MPNLTWLYAGAIYAACVTLARRAGAGLPKRIAFFFFAIVLLFFREPLTTDTINAPVDYYESLPPWVNVIKHPHPVNPFVNDVALQLVPWAHAVREQWRAFEAPLWEPTAASGYPLLANGQSQALSILRLLALPLDLGHALTAEGVWKVLIALTFTFLFCRRRGYSITASSIGAIAYGFSGFMLVWLHFGHATVAAMLPAALYVVDLLAERVTGGRFAFASLIWGVILTGGHPETAAYAGLLAVLYTGWIAFVERRAGAWGFIRASGGSVVAGTLLAAPFLIPFAEAVKKSQRFSALAGAGHPSGILADWASTIATLQPHFFGFVPYEQPWGPAIPEAITGFAGTFAVAGAIALFAHVATTRAWRSREAFVLVALLISIGVIYDWPGIIQIFNLVFRLAPPARMRCLFALLTSICAAAAVDLRGGGGRFARTKHPPSSAHRHLRREPAAADNDHVPVSDAVASRHGDPCAAAGRGRARGCCRCDALARRDSRADGGHHRGAQHGFWRLERGAAGVEDVSGDAADSRIDAAESGSAEECTLSHRRLQRRFFSEPVDDVWT